MKRNLPFAVMIAAAVVLIAGLFCNVALAEEIPVASNSTTASAPMPSANESHLAKRGFFFDESSTVRGSGEVSIKGSFHDYAAQSRGWMKGSGSISFESLRSMNKVGREVDFIQKSDLVFTGGQLKNRKSMSLPLFGKGIGATVSERFNLSHVDRSETDILSSTNRFNNTMLYNTALAFEGQWNLMNVQGWAINTNKSDEKSYARYKGSYQIQKMIQLDDSALYQ